MLSRPTGPATCVRADHRQRCEDCSKCGVRRMKSPSKPLRSHLFPSAATRAHRAVVALECAGIADVCARLARSRRRTTARHNWPAPSRYHDDAFALIDRGVFGPVLLQRVLRRGFVGETGLALGGGDLVADPLTDDLPLELGNERSTLRVSRPIDGRAGRDGFYSLLPGGSSNGLDSMFLVCSSTGWTFFSKSWKSRRAATESSRQPITLL